MAEFKTTNFCIVVRNIYNIFARKDLITIVIQLGVYIIKMYNLHTMNLNNIMLNLLLFSFNKMQSLICSCGLYLQEKCVDAFIFYD